MTPLVFDMMENALLDDEMVADFALLVPRDAVARLDTRIEELDQLFEMAGHIHQPGQTRRVVECGGLDVREV